MAGNQLAVLLLENDQDAAVAVEGLLSSLGCDVDHCLHPHEALFGLSSSLPDLLLLGLPLPKMTAAAFLTSLQSVEAAGALPVVALVSSGPDPQDEITELLDKGLRDHLKKPVTRDELAAMLERCGGGRQAADAKPKAEPAEQEPVKKNLFDKLRQEVPVSSNRPALQHDLSGSSPTSAGGDTDSAAALVEPDEAAASAAEPDVPKPEAPEIDGPKMEAQLADSRCTMTIEMAMGESIVAWVGEQRLETGTEFRAQLSYPDPAPGRNRMIPVKLSLRVFSCNPAGERSYRCVLKIESVRPAERWAQFVRVCKAKLEESEGSDKPEDSS